MKMKNVDYNTYIHSGYLINTMETVKAEYDGHLLSLLNQGRDNKDMAVIVKAINEIFVLDDNNIPCEYYNALTALSDMVNISVNDRYVQLDYAINCNRGYVESYILPFTGGIYSSYVTNEDYNRRIEVVSALNWKYDAVPFDRVNMMAGDIWYW